MAQQSKYAGIPARQTEAKMPPPPASPPQGEVAVADNPWRPMHTAPVDGSYVYLQGDPSHEEKEIANEWFWYRTREYKDQRWKATGWWRKRFGTTAPPSFTPKGWRSVKEGLPT